MPLRVKQRNSILSTHKKATSIPVLPKEDKGRKVAFLFSTLKTFTNEKNSLTIFSASLQPVSVAARLVQR